MNIEEVKNVILHVIKNNKYLEENKKKKTTLCVEGPSGVGKTSLIEQIANDHNLHYVKKNLAEMEETSELVGFPIREFETTDGIWLNEQQLRYTQNIQLTNNTRTAYCQPEWVPQGAEEKGGILLLDDFSRADARLVQATMELVDRSSYGSWSLPSGWSVVLSTNPDNGDYFVTSMDQAQSTRFIKINVDMSIDVWAKWAERAGIDSRCINFLLLNPEMINDDADHPVNARLATDFFNSISSLGSFKSSYELINLLGLGSVGQEFTQTFLSFIDGNLDNIPSPDQIFKAKDAEEAAKLIQSATGDPSKSEYKQHIASVICSRLINNVQKKIDAKEINEDHLHRTVDVLKSERFVSDINHHFYKSLNAITQKVAENFYINDVELVKKYT